MYVCTYKAACVCWSWSWNVSFDKYRVWCLSITSQGDSLSTTSIPKSFPNFGILFTLHHSLLAPAPPSCSTLPSPQPSPSLVFLLYYRQISPGLVMQLHPTSLFFFHPLPRWQLSLSIAAVLHLRQLCLFWFLQPLLGSHSRICQPMWWVTERARWVILHLVLYLLPSQSSQGFSVILCL